MAHFHIDPGTPSLSLPAARRGQLSFTVTNNLGRPARIQASVLPEGGAKPEWLSIEGETERDLSPTETQTFIVKVQVPPDVVPGEQRFRLLVASVARPDDEYDTSPPVAFTISEATQRAFPWWIVAVAAGVLVIVGGGLGLFFALGGPGLGDPCEQAKADCGKGLACTQRGTQTLCLATVGTKCKDGTDCTTGTCGANGKCEQKPPGANCATNADCPEDQKCTDTRPGVKACLLKAGQPCTQDAVCSTWCIEPKSVCAPENGACTDATDCPSADFGCFSGFCKVAEGKPCRDHAVCVTNNCESGVCRPCTQVCLFPLRCVGNQCVGRFTPILIPNYREFIRKPVPIVPVK